MKSTHGGWLVPLLIGGTVYCLTMCRTVYVGDSGEFALAFRTLGIAHPPGYPLFTLLGHLFLTITFFFTPAFSANLFSLLTAAASIPVLFFVLGGRDRPVITGILTLIWALSLSFWGETVAVEVYALNLLFVALVLALAFGSHPKKWYVLAYLTGLAMAHHLTAAAVIPALLFVFYREKAYRQPQTVIMYIALVLLGLSVYLYLPTRASVSPIADWGHPSSLTLLFNHVTAAQYQSAAAFTGSNLWVGTLLFLKLIVANWWWVALPLLAGGIVVGIKRNFDRTVALLVLIVANLILAAFYRIPDIDPYYLPALLGCFLLMAEAVFWLWERLQSQSHRLAGQLIGGGLVILMIASNFGRSDKSDFTLAQDYGKLILDTAGSGTVFTKDDNASFAALYLRYAEDYQPGVEVFDQAVRMKALVDRARSLSRRTVSDYSSARLAYLQNAPGPKYLVKSHFPYDEEWTNVGVGLGSRGILYAYDQPASWSKIPSPGSSVVPRDFKTRQILINLELSRTEDILSRESPDSVRARKGCKEALNYLEDEPRGSLHNQLGISFRHLGYGDLALVSYERGLDAPRLSATERGEIIFNISNIHKDRGNARAAAGDAQGALEAFLEALKYDPANARLFYNIGVIYVNYLNQPEKGLPYLETYLSNNPRDENVRELVRQHQKN